jgi:Ca-activated chloride channel homolog
MVNGETRTFVYDDLLFSQVAGGQPFIARLWATRRIADLLNTIRIQGENPELIDSIVSLSVRYGIITPYTSFLIEEDDILTQQGREEALAQADDTIVQMAGETTGSGAVGRAADLADMEAASVMPAPTMAAVTQEAPMDGAESDANFSFPEPEANAITTIGDKTFIQLNSVWTDTLFQPDTMTSQKVEFLSDEYFALLEQYPQLAEYFALGEKVIVVIDDTAYEVVAAA